MPGRICATNASDRCGGEETPRRSPRPTTRPPGPGRHLNPTPVHDTRQRRPPRFAPATAGIEDYASCEALRRSPTSLTAPVADNESSDRKFRASPTTGERNSCARHTRQKSRDRFHFAVQGQVRTCGLVRTRTARHRRHPQEQQPAGNPRDRRACIELDRPHSSERVSRRSTCSTRAPSLPPPSRDSRPGPGRAARQHQLGMWIAALGMTLLRRPISNPISGGAIVGLIIGAGQATLGRRRLDPRRWIPATTVGMGLGLLLGAVAVDYRTSLTDLMLLLDPAHRPRPADACHLICRDPGAPIAVEYGTHEPIKEVDSGRSPLTCTWSIRRARRPSPGGGRSASARSGSGWSARAGSPCRRSSATPARCRSTSIPPRRPASGDRGPTGCRPDPQSTSPGYAAERSGASGAEG